MSRFVLAYASFRWLWTSSLFSYGSMWIQQASIAWLAYEISSSSALVGAVVGVRMIPLLALMPLSGVAADRYDRKRLLQASQWFAAGTALAFGAALALNRVDTWMLFAFTLLMGAANVIDRPARHSTVFDLVPREVVPRAVTLNVIGSSCTRILGPAIAGYLIAWVGVAGNFFVQGALYLAAGAMILFVVLPPRRQAAQPLSAMKDLTTGLRYLVTDPTTRVLISIAVLQYFLLVPTFAALFPVFAKDIFEVGPQGLGIMFTTIGIGGVLGGFVAGALMRFDRIGLIQTGALLVFCAALLGLAASPSFHLALAACLAAGVAEMVISTNNMTMLQMSAPPQMRGRVVSLVQLNPALISAGSFVIGPLGDLLGARGATGATAAVCAGLVVTLLAGSPRLRALQLSSYQSE
jgi:MFS family permease